MGTLTNILFIYFKVHYQIQNISRKKYLEIVESAPFFLFFWLDFVCFNGHPLPTSSQRHSVLLHENNCEMIYRGCVLHSLNSPGKSACVQQPQN